MTHKPLQPRRPEIPAGFTDAFGLDDVSIAFKPKVIKAKMPEAEGRGASKKRAPQRDMAMGK